MIMSAWIPNFVMLALISSKYFLGRVLGRGNPPWMSLARVGTPNDPTRGGSHLLVPSLDPPSPVQLPTVFQLISSTWRGGGNKGLMGWEKGLGSHNVPSAPSE